MTDTTDNSVNGEAAVLSDLEHLIRTHITNLDKLKTDLRTQREMLTSTLTNDETYRTHHDKVKEATKIRSATKKQIMSLPANKALAEKILEQTIEARELDSALSEYLREYARLSGSNEFEVADGEVREIVYVAKLIKKPKTRR